MCPACSALVRLAACRSPCPSWLYMKFGVWSTASHVTVPSRNRRRPGTLAILLHGFEQSAEGIVSAGHGGRIVTARGEDSEGVLDRRGNALGAHHRGAPAGGLLNRGRERGRWRERGVHDRAESAHGELRRRGSARSRLKMASSGACSSTNRNRSRKVAAEATARWTSCASWWPKAVATSSSRLISASRSIRAWALAIAALRRLGSGHDRFGLRPRRRCTESVHRMPTSLIASIVCVPFDDGWPKSVVCQPMSSSATPPCARSPVAVPRPAPPSQPSPVLAP